MGAACARAWAGAAAATSVEPHLGVTLEERFDDDPLLLALPGNGAFGGEFLTKLSPRLGLTARDRTLDLDGWYAGDFYVHDGSGRFAFDHRAGLTTKKRVTSRLTFALDAHLWRVSDPTSLPRLDVAHTLSPVLYGDALATLSYRLTERLTAGAGYRFQGVQIFDGVSGPGLMHAPFLEAWYRLTRTADLGADYRLQIFQFAREPSQAQSASVALRQRLTPLWTATLRAGPVLYAGPDPQRSGWLPRVQLDATRHGERIDVSLQVGHDLVGASGFTSALWADYASVFLNWKLQRHAQLFGALSLYRDGGAPNQYWLSLDPTHLATGYGLGVGAEWNFSRTMALQITGDRYAQIGLFGGPQVQLVRDIAAARIVFTPW